MISEDKNPKAVAKRTLLIGGVVLLVVGTGVGILIGKFGICKEKDKRDGLFLPGIPEAIIKDGDPTVGEKLINAIDNKKIEGYLKHLTRVPHVAGTPADLEQALWLKKFWEDSGFDDVRLTPYDVLLSYPDKDAPNVVRLLDENNNTVYESPEQEANLTGEIKEGVIPPFNAYSPPGVVEGELVYVNYGRVFDYDWLAYNTSINITGKIVIARYGKIFRGSKVAIAASKGARGIILFSDPQDYAWAEDPRVYPDTWWLPPSGAQRGTTFLGGGDPLTPGYPAIKSAYRYPEDKVEPSLPKIPTHPIGYGIAEKLLREMTGPEVVSTWRGGLNITYRYGPSFKNSAWRIQMRISTDNHNRTTYNVIGIIRGQIEPDRYVMFGNHRDSWVYGAIDPSSGTAAMMEASRVLAELVKSGTWRPRRSIMFCSWGSEEYGLLGSNEYTEQYIKTLRERAVAYINIDVALQGNYSLQAQGAPLLYRAMFEAAKKVPNPNQAEVAAGRKTVFDTWLNTYPWMDGDKSLSIPTVWPLGSSSDYAPLLQKAGITAMDFWYTYNTKKYKIASYPLYHSVYETFYAVKNIMDKEFEYHRAVSRLGCELVRNLADSLIIPFNVSDYGWIMENNRAALEKRYGRKLRQNLENFDELSVAVADFAKEIEEFSKRIANVNRNDPMATRKINDQLMLLEKAFLDPEGLPDRPLKKHLIFAESSHNSYAGSSFPGLVDLMFEIDKATDQKARWERVRRHFSVILFTIQSAASTLRDVTKFIPRHM